jgi:ribulose 1,5-bisphosphate synthetase/thiazole synthase
VAEEVLYNPGAATTVVMSPGYYLDGIVLAAAATAVSASPRMAATKGGIVASGTALRRKSHERVW